MDGQTRQRLIGVILLLLLAAILAPLLFRSPDEVRVALEMDIPEPPPVVDVEPTPVIDEERIESTRENIRRERAAALQAATGTAEDKEGQQEGGEPPLSGWSVQVASFSDRDNALTLSQRLRDAGYNAYWREVRQDDEALYRVFAGPELQRDDALELKRRLALDESFGQDGLVVPYEP